jgi:hypothetical protein
MGRGPLPLGQSQKEGSDRFSGLLRPAHKFYVNIPMRPNAIEVAMKPYILDFHGQYSKRSLRTYLYDFYVNVAALQQYFLLDRNSIFKTICYMTVKEINIA